MKQRNMLLALIVLLAGLSVLLVGCGNDVDNKVTPPPAETYPNASLLISGDELQHLLGGKNLAVIDARSAGYDVVHIPGAISMPHPVFAAGASLNLKPIADLETLLTDTGITQDMKIVIYDDTTASWGAAGRIFWILEYLGCTDVHLLNGGWNKWSADGRKTEVTASLLPQAEKPFAAALKPAKLMNKNRISNRLGNSDFAVVDSRTDEEFNGWILYNEARGGHMKGAVQMQYEHFYNEDKTILSYADLKEFFESKGVTPDKEVTAYCTAGIRSGFVYFTLRLMGYQKASNYAGSMWDWSAASVSDPDKYPMEQMPRYDKLVYAGWVQQLIAGGNPPTYPGKGYVILYTSYEPRYSENRTDYHGTVYEKGHIPGAIFMDTYSLENGPDSEYGDGYKYPEEAMVKPIGELQTFLGDLGISKDKTVIVYADDDITMMTVGRTAWALLKAGVNDVRILNGNYKAWVANGGTIETTPNTLAPVAFGDSDGNPQYLATMDDVRNVVNGTVTNVVIADDRSLDEYLGLSNSYYTYFHAFGRIPTAQWIGDWTDIVSKDVESLRTYTEVEQNWKNEGFSPDKKIYFHCGTGWRSGLYTFYAYLLDWQGANYDGGWFDWSYYHNPSWNNQLSN